MKSVHVHLPLDDAEVLDKLVSLKYYPSRNEAIRFAVHDLVRKERKLIEAKSCE